MLENANPQGDLARVDFYERCFTKSREKPCSFTVRKVLRNILFRYRCSAALTCRKKQICALLVRLCSLQVNKAAVVGQPIANTHN